MEKEYTVKCVECGNKFKARFEADKLDGYETLAYCTECNDVKEVTLSGAFQAKKKS